MPLQKLPTTGLDDINHRRRARETLNNVLDHSFDDSRVQTTAEKLAGVTPVNYAYAPGNLKRHLTTAQSAGDGADDIRAALQAACDVMPDNTGGVLFIPRGIWRVVGTVFVKPKTVIVGEGWASQISFEATGNGDTCFENDLAASGPDGWLEFRDIYLKLNNRTVYHSVNAIDLRDRSGGSTEHSSYCKIVNVKFTHWNWRAIYMDKSTVSVIELCEFDAIQNYHFGAQAGVAWPIYINGTGNSVSIRNNHFISCDAVLRVIGAVLSANIRFIDNTLETSAYEAGVYDNTYIAEHVFITNCFKFYMAHNYVEGLYTGDGGDPGTDHLVRLQTCIDAVIFDNYLQGTVGAEVYTYRFVQIESDCKNTRIVDNQMFDPSNAYVRSEAVDTIVKGGSYYFGGSRETAVLGAIRTHVSGTMLLENNDYAQSVAFAASLDVDARAGRYIAVGALTNNITINAPTNPPSEPGFPLDIFIELLQDGTGGRTVTLNAVFVSNYSNTGNTANTRNHGRFTWTGSQWRGDWTGWF